MEGAALAEFRKDSSGNPRETLPPAIPGRAG